MPASEYGLCECGCGRPTAIAKRARKGRPDIKGEPVRFVKGHNQRGKVDPKRQRLLWPLRFLTRVGTEDGNGCLLWTGAQGNHGYGCVMTGGEFPELTHRAAFRLVRGSIPEGHHVHHTCENKLCVNPDHLEVMTAADHLLLHHALRTGQ